MNNENKKHTMQIMYDEAKNMLKEICPKNVDLKKYFDLEKSFKTKEDIFYTLLVCLQDRNRFDKVIGFERPERKDIFRKLLFDYDCNMILANYNEETLLNTFAKNFKINNIESKQNTWRQYAKSIITSAKFLNEFKDAKEFDSFVMQYNGKQVELISLLADKIYGMAFALAAHFLKELGYKEYAKPDSHIINLFVSLNLSINNDISVFNTILEMSKVVDDTPYNLDKLFWLICSGNFHIDKTRVGEHEKKFIDRVKKRLQKEKIETKENERLLKESLENCEKLGVTKCSRFTNNYKYDYARITLNDKIVSKFFSGKDKDKKAIDVIIKYNEDKDALIIEKIKD